MYSYSERVLVYTEMMMMVVESLRGCGSLIVRSEKGFRQGTVVVVVIVIVVVAVIGDVIKTPIFAVRLC